MLRALAALSLLLGLALAGAGCPAVPGDPDGGGDAGAPECTSRGDCADGLACSPEGACVPCESSGQCLLREVCNPQSLVCELKAGWGSACARNADCQLGEYCRQGLCLVRDLVRLCTPGAEGACARGQRCNAVNEVCEEDLGCAEEADCGAEETCNVALRRCVPRCTEETQGTVCAAGERCVQERCVQCTQGSECSAGATCDPAGRCVLTPRCASDRDCKVPLVCHTPTGACLEKPPPCSSDESCAPEDRCDLGSGACVPRGCQADRYEPNDSRETASPVAPGSYEALVLCEGDVDFWALGLTTGDRLGVNLRADGFSEAAFTTLVMDGTGRTVASGRLSASYVASAPGLHYVAISSSDALQRYDVTFLLARGTPCIDTGPEPNDTPAQATPLNASREVDGAICPQDADHYAVEVPDGRPTLRASLVDHDDTAGPLSLCVLQGGVQVACAPPQEGVAPTVSVPVSAERTLVVRVRGQDDRVANVYTLHVEFP